MTIKFSENLVDHANWVEKSAQLGALTITLGKSKKALSDSAEFLPNKVADADGRELWKFDKSYVDCLAFLREVNSEYLIVYATRKEVVDIILLNDLPNTIRLAGGQYDWKRPFGERLQLKLAAAEVMEREPRLSPIEKALKTKIDADIRAHAAAKATEVKARLTAEQEARRQAREERRRELMRRPRITAFTASGEKKTGIPVVADEWQSLGNGVDCIAVNFYQMGTAGIPSEAFFVKVEGSKKSRQRVVTVHQTDPTAPKLVEKQGEILVEYNGQTDVIACYTQDGLAQLQKEGLNAGAIRACWPANEDGTFTLVSFSKGGRRTVGNFEPIAVV